MVRDWTELMNMEENTSRQPGKVIIESDGRDFQNYISWNNYQIKIDKKVPEITRLTSVKLSSWDDRPWEGCPWESGFPPSCGKLLVFCCSEFKLHKYNFKSLKHKNIIALPTMQWFQTSVLVSNLLDFGFQTILSWDLWRPSICRDMQSIATLGKVIYTAYVELTAMPREHFSIRLMGGQLIAWWPVVTELNGKLFAYGDWDIFL